MTQTRSGHLTGRTYPTTHHHYHHPTPNPPPAISSELLLNGLRHLRWKDYSANSSLIPSTLQEYQPGFDPRRHILSLHVGADTLEEQEREREDAAVTTTEIPLVDGEDLDGVLGRMVEEEEERGRKRKAGKGMMGGEAKRRKLEEGD